MARFLYAFLVVGVAIVAAQDYSPTNYNAGDSGRSETVSPDGSVTGQYSYTDPNGKIITVKYRAGKDGFQVEGDHLPKSPAAPQQGPPAPAQHQQQQPQAPTHGPNGYNPFHNPHVPAHLYQQAPTHPPPAQSHHQPQAPTHAPNGYNPFHNPHVPAHLYQQAPTHAPSHAQARAPSHSPAAPTHAPLPAPGQGYNPFYNPDIEKYNPFHNPNVPDHLYNQAPQGQRYNQPAPQPQRYNQPAPQPHHNPAPAQQGGQFPAGTFAGHGPSNSQFGSFSHPNAIPGAPQKNGGGGRVSVSQQNGGFNYNYNV